MHPRRFPGGYPSRGRSLQSTAADARRRSCRHGRRHGSAAARRSDAAPAPREQGTRPRAPADDRRGAPTDGQPTRAAFRPCHRSSRRHPRGRRVPRLPRRVSGGGVPPTCRRPPLPAPARGQQPRPPCHAVASTSRRRWSGPRPRRGLGPDFRRGRTQRDAGPIRPPARGVRRSGRRRQSGPASATAGGAGTRRRVRDARRHCRLGIWREGTYH